METVGQLRRLLDLEQVADAWRVSTHTVRLWVKQRRLHPVRVCRRLLFDPAECERFLNAEGARKTQDPNASEEVAI